MNLDNLEILADSIKGKNKIVTPKNLVLESLFFNFGTLNEVDASELLFLKREQIEKKIIKKYGKLNSDVICPVALCYNKWAGNKSILDKY